MLVRIAENWTRYATWMGILFGQQWLVILILLNFGPSPGPDSPLVRPHPELTFITEPLLPGGDVDYARYLDEKFSQGVTAKNNAYVDMVSIIGPVESIAELPDEWFAKLEIARPPDGAAYHQSLEEWCIDHLAELPKEFHSEDEKKAVELASLYSRLFEDVPVDLSGHPVAARWFQEMRPFFAMYRQASVKPHYFSPCRFFGDLTPMAMELRQLHKSMIQSANIRLGMGDVDGAINDCMAIAGMARHEASNGNESSFMYSSLTHHYFTHGFYNILYSGRCSERQLKRMADEISAFVEHPSRIQRIHLLYSRCDSLRWIARYPRNMNNYEGVAWRAGKKVLRTDGIPELRDRCAIFLGRSMVDWKTAMKMTNDCYDELEAAFLEEDEFNGWTDLNERIQRAKKLADRLESKEFPDSGFMDPWNLIKRPFEGYRRRGVKIANFYLAIQARNIANEANTCEAGWINEARLCGTAIAVERFLRDQNRLPGDLSELVPSWLPSVPVDMFTGEPFIYRAGDDNYALYSIWRNGVDDGGTRRDEDDKIADIVARPEFLTEVEWKKAALADEKD